MLALKGRDGMAAVDVGACKVFPANEGSWEEHQERLLPAERILPAAGTCREGGDTALQLLGPD